jgi:surface protein
MKIKTLFGAGLVLTSALASCSSEDLLKGSQNASTNTLTAYIESQNDSRVSISDEGKFAWSTDDKISVASASNSFETWSLSKINDDGSADFTSSSTVSDGAYAVFPETLNPTVSGNSLQITLPAEYESNKTVPVLTGKYNDGKVDFAHAGGLIRVSFDNVPSYANKFVFSTNNQNIAGDFTIDDDQAINTSAGTNSKITINIAGDDIKDGKITFDIPVPVGTYEGFSVGLYFGDIELASQSTTNSNTIERRDLLVMPTITATDYFAGSDYVVERIKPSSTESEINILDGTSDTCFNLSKINKIYIDGSVELDATLTYQFPNTEEHIVVITINGKLYDCTHMFLHCSDITSLDLSHLDTSNVTKTYMMFQGCSSLTSLDLSNWDTSNLTETTYMFSGCSGLKSLNLSNFNTSKVKIMSYMFYGCSSLTSLNLSSFDTSNVTKMGYMFWDCSSLTSLDLSSFDTSNVTEMWFMFKGCSSLTSLDLSNFNTSKVTTMAQMFQGCSGLTSLNLSSFDTSNVTVMGLMFSGCSSLTSLDLSNLDTSNVTNMGSMFSGCSGLTSLDLSNFNTSKVTTMAQMFQGCSDLTSINTSNWKTSSVKDMNHMFQGCSGLISFSPNFSASLVENMKGMFFNCSSLKSLDLSKFYTSKVTNMNQMFQGCSSLTSLDLSKLDTSNVTNMGYMFQGCSSLTSLDLSKLDTSNVTAMNHMFYGCSSLTSLDLSKWDTSSVTGMYYMFLNCSSLKTIKMMGDISSLNKGQVYGMFENVASSGTFYYPETYKTDYNTKILSNLPSSWTKTIVSAN